jgi:hypothetical protein
MTSPGHNAVEVFVFQAGRFLGSRCFTQSTIVIGSERTATLRLRDESIHERHAVLRVKGDALVLASNGDVGAQVLINGESISVRQVHSFDEIRIGPFRLKLTLLGGKAEEDPGFGATADGPSATEAAPRPERAAAKASTARPSRRSERRKPAAAPAPAAWDADPEDAPTRQHIPAWDSEPRGLGDIERAGEFDDDSVTSLRPAPRGEPASSQLDVASALGPMGDDVDSTHDPFERTGQDPAQGRRSRRRPSEAVLEAREDTTAPQRALRPSPAEAQPQRTSRSQQAETPRKQAPSEALFDEFDGGFGSPAEEQATWSPEKEQTAVETVAPGTGSWDAEPQPPRGAQPGRPDHETPFARTEKAGSPAPSASDFAYEPEEDEDEDEPFVEPFSLLENIVRERFKTPTETQHQNIVEVIRYRNGEILDLLPAKPGQSIHLEPDGFRLLRVTGDGSADLYFQADASGSLVRGGKARQLKRLARADTLVDPRNQLHAIKLREGDYAQVVRGEAGYLARFVRPPTVPQPKERFRLDLSKVQMFAGSAAFHFLVLVLLGFVAPEADLHVETEAERFAKVTVKELKLEKPKEEPKKEEPPPEAPPEQPQDAPKPKRKAPRARRRPASAAQRARAQQQQQKKQVSNVLTALQNVAPSGAPGRSNLKSLVTNVKAVRAPAGSGSGFKIAGTIGKIAGKGIRLAGGTGGGGKDTKIGSQLLAGGKIGAVKALAGTGTRVRGRARRAPTRKIGTTGGTLSREAIQRVVSKHMHKIQACYERQLLVNRGLAGKIVFDWVISPGGSVASARQARSTVASTAVSSCILAEIKRWRFPKPVGGSVQVRYPFVFRVQGF